MQKVVQLQNMVDRRAGADPREAEKKRRRAIRHNCRVLVELEVGHSAGYGDTWTVDTIKFKGRLLDLSIGGASIFTKRMFEAEQGLRLTIEFGQTDKLTLKSVVRWVKSMPDKGGYATGVKFVHVPEREGKLITRFLKQLDATAGL